MKLSLSFFLVAFVFFTFFQLTESSAQLIQGGNIHGNFELNSQVYNVDSSIGSEEVPEKYLMNAYANFIYTNDNFKAGFRYEAYLNTMLGFDQRYDGQGIPYMYLSYQNEGFDVTAGNFYEQFGSGLILRTYEDKALGYDNSLSGVRIKYKPIPGVQFKGIVGRQRSFFDLGPGIVRGFDIEFNLNDIVSERKDATTQYIFGGSMVSKFQKDDDPVYRLPENVSAFSGRISINHKMLNLSGEYAYKINDPSTDNSYIYKNGNAFLLNMSYAAPGLGIYLGIKRLDNMSFRSDRNASLNNLNINFLPPVTKSHTYSLAGMYPYATQANGEVGFQAEVNYRFRPGSKLGGKYGMQSTINYSNVYSIQKEPKYDGTGYTSDFFRIGEDLYFRDFNLKLSRKLSKSFKGSIKYLNLVYNKDVIQGLAGNALIRSHIGIVDVTYRFQRTKSLRTEIQHLSTKQDKGDWIMGLIEYSVAPHWFVSISDEYNYGNPIEEKKLHYYMMNMGFKKGPNRFQIGYGRQRDGIVCIGGVCRRVPASSGLFISITSSF